MIIQSAQFGVVAFLSKRSLLQSSLAECPAKPAGGGCMYIWKTVLILAGKGLLVRWTSWDNQLLYIWTFPTLMKLIQAESTTIKSPNCLADSYSCRG